MSKGFFNVPVAINEPVKTYAPGTPEREEVLKAFKELYIRLLIFLCILEKRKSEREIPKIYFRRLITNTILVYITRQIKLW